jgi:digeranylgeranylglycerophospholipid reductase
MQNFDIIVVGAGPGGSIAAKTAADNGYSVCFFEKEEIGSNGRYKACGGAMAWELVEQINYPEDKIERVIESLELHHVDGEVFSKKGKGAIIWRNVFDKFLSDMAKDCGAALKDKEKLIEIIKNGELYYSC